MPPIMPKISGIPVPGRPQAKKKEPKNSFAGEDILVPWNIGTTVFRYKAAAPLTISDVTIDVGEIISPSGAPVVIEAWKNGRYAGEVIISNGATEMKQSLPLQKLDEIELRILVKGERTDETRVKKLWFLYCVD